MSDGAPVHVEPFELDFANRYDQLNRIAERTEGARAESGLFVKIREDLRTRCQQPAGIVHHRGWPTQPLAHLF